MRPSPLALFAIAAVTTLPALTLHAQGLLRTTRNATLPNISWGFDVAAGDVDGDGDIDLVVGNDHDPNQLLLNDGRGSFEDATVGRLTTPTVPPPNSFFANATYAVDLADIDGDGDLDLLLCNDHNLPNRVHVNNGAGVFTDVTATALPSNQNYSVDQVVADFDGDGDVDWFVNNSGGNRLYLNNGAGVFTDASSNLPAGGDFFVRNSSAVDVDQDGDLDLLLNTTYDNGVPQILRNNGLGAFGLTLLPMPLFGPTIAADLDGDGTIDLTTEGGKFYRGLGNLSFAAPQQLAQSPKAAADLDLDGDLDLLGEAVVMRNDLPAGFASVPTPDLTFVTFGGFAIADLDGDQDLDFVPPLFNNDPPRMNFTVQIETPSAPSIGQSYDVVLHANPSTPATVFGLGVSFAGSNTPLAPFGTLRIDLNQGLLLGAVVATSSPTTLSWTIPNVPGLVGTEIHYQSIVAAPNRPLFLSNAVRDVVL